MIAESFKKNRGGKALENHEGIGWDESFCRNTRSFRRKGRTKGARRRFNGGFRFKKKIKKNQKGKQGKSSLPGGGGFQLETTEDQTKN